jgi:hypothetical protein
MNQSLTIDSNNFDKSRATSQTKVAESRGRSQKVAQRRGVQHGGDLQVHDRPKDYRCILNEPIWFSKFLIAEERNKSGRFFNKDIECRLVNLGISHLSDLVSLDQSQTRFCWISPFEAEVKTRSKVLGKAITKIIAMILIYWSHIVYNKIREAFHMGDWFVLDSDPEDISISKITGMTDDLLLVNQHALDEHHIGSYAFFKTFRNSFEDRSC